MKTAVQWLKEQYIDRGETIPSGVFQEALEKEKEQIIESFDNGIYVGTYAVDKDGEQYYNQTYSQDSELPKEDKTFKQKSKWTKLYEEVLEKEEEVVDHEIIIEELRKAVTQMQKEIRLLKNATRPLK
jgi:hypothetical protein